MRHLWNPESQEALVMTPKERALSLLNQVEEYLVFKAKEAKSKGEQSEFGTEGAKLVCNVIREALNA